MSALDHDATRALADAATDGPWITEESSSLDRDGIAVGRHVSGIWNAAGVPVASFAEPWPDGPDAEFIAAARTVVPQLLDELEHVSATANMRAGQIKALRDQADKLTADGDLARAEVQRLTRHVAGLINVAWDRGVPMTCNTCGHSGYSHDAKECWYTEDGPETRCSCNRVSLWPTAMIENGATQ